MYARARPRRIKDFHPSRDPPRPLCLNHTTLLVVCQDFFSRSANFYVRRLSQPLRSVAFRLSDSLSKLASCLSVIIVQHTFSKSQHGKIHKSGKLNLCKILHIFLLTTAWPVWYNISRPLSRVRGPGRKENRGFFNPRSRGIPRGTRPSWSAPCR